jgi:hypothetical protein
MDAYIAQQPASSTGDTPGRSGGTGRRCVRFGCLEAAPGSSATLKAASWRPARSTWTCCSATPLRGCRRTAASGWRSVGPELPGLRDPQPTAIAAGVVMVTGPASAGRVAPCWSVGLQMLPETGVLSTGGVTAGSTHRTSPPAAAYPASASSALKAVLFRCSRAPSLFVDSRSGDDVRPLPTHQLARRDPAFSGNLKPALILPAQRTLARVVTSWLTRAMPAGRASQSSVLPMRRPSVRPQRVRAVSAPASQQVEHNQPDSHQSKEDEQVPDDFHRRLQHPRKAAR